MDSQVIGLSPSPSKICSNSLFETSCLRDATVENICQNSKINCADFTLENMGTILEEVNSQPSTQNCPNNFQINSEKSLLKEQISKDEQPPLFSFGQTKPLFGGRPKNKNSRVSFDCVKPQNSLNKNFSPFFAAKSNDKNLPCAHFDVTGQGNNAPDRFIPNRVSQDNSNSNCTVDYLLMESNKSINNSNSRENFSSGSGLTTTKQFFLEESQDKQIYQQNLIAAQVKNQNHLHNSSEILDGIQQPKLSRMLNYSKQRNTENVGLNSQKVLLHNDTLDNIERTKKARKIITQRKKG